MIAELNKMAKAFADEFNEVHRSGFGLPPTDPTESSETGINFFGPWNSADSSGLI